MYQHSRLRLCKFPNKLLLPFTLDLYLPSTHIIVQLESIQNSLFDLGAAVATPLDASSERRVAKTAFDADKTAELERWIDGHTARLPPLKQFILPGGGHAGATLHLARSVCRRAERAVVPLVRDGVTDPAVGIFLNRLSDYLFTAARMAAQAAGTKDRLYFPPR